MKPESLSLLRDRALTACRGWGGYIPAEMTGQQECSTRIIGIEGWEDTKPEVIPTAGNPHHQDLGVREGTRNGNRSLIMMALGILTALLLYISKLLTVSSDTEVVSRSELRQHQELEDGG